MQISEKPSMMTTSNWPCPVADRNDFPSHNSTIASQTVENRRARTTDGLVHQLFTAFNSHTGSL